MHLNKIQGLSQHLHVGYIISPQWFRVSPSDFICARYKKQELFLYQISFTC